MVEDPALALRCETEMTPDFLRETVVVVARLA